MLEKITGQYGKERRTWIMDRGIPTEETLHQMRQADPSVRYLIGTPKGRLTRLEKDLATKDWQAVKDDVQVKLLNRDGELYVLARSLPRRCKESAMRRKKLKATGLSSRSVLERMSEIQMLDVTIPATDGRELRMRRYTKPEKIHHLLLDQLGFTLPSQPPPEIRNPKPVMETF